MSDESAVSGGTAALRPESAPAALATADLPALALAINAAHREAQAYASKAVERALQAGDLLLTVKARLAHGEFGDWCASNLPALSERTVRNYMRVARELPRQNGNAADLTLRGALRLLTGPEPEPELGFEPDPLTANEPAVRIRAYIDSIESAMAWTAAILRDARKDFKKHPGVFEEWCEKVLKMPASLRDTLLAGNFREPAHTDGAFFDELIDFIQRQHDAFGLSSHTGGAA